MLTVIMPAAGKGTRLNLPYPKEILRLDLDRALIDYSFDFFKDRRRDEVEFVVVINEEKTDIIKYLSKYKDRFNISFTFQNPNELEYTGAIKSARHLFGENNLVLLPDTFMELQDGKNLFDDVMLSLSRTDFVFLYKPETNYDMLKTKGSLHVHNGSVWKYEDKPKIMNPWLNAYWCAFGFRDTAFDRGISFMEKSTLNQKTTLQIENTPLNGCGAIAIKDYRDLGTWGEIRRLIHDTV